MSELQSTLEIANPSADTILNIGGLATLRAIEIQDLESLWVEPAIEPGFTNDYADALAVPETERSPLDERELSFFWKVFSAGMEMAEGHDNPVVLMFDVDQTLTEENEQYKRIVRPAFRLAINELHKILPNQLRVGLLTTVDSQYVSSECFEGIDDAVVDKDFVIDVRKYSKEEKSNFDFDKLHEIKGDEAEKQALKQLEGILNPTIYSAIESDRLDLSTVYSEGKLEILSELIKNPKEGYENARYLFVDNLLYAGMLNPNNPNVRGLHVGPETQANEYRNEVYTAQLRYLNSALTEAKIYCGELSVICATLGPVLNPVEKRRLKRLKEQSQTHK